MAQSKYDKKGRDLEGFLLNVIYGMNIPELKDLQRLSGFIEIKAFDHNRMKLNKIELFNLN